MLQQTLQTNFTRLMNFIGFAKGYVIRHNPIKALQAYVTQSIKDMLTVNKKLKLAQYRLNYHKHQLYKMESLIADNNEHTFFKGKKMNEVR